MNKFTIHLDYDHQSYTFHSQYVAENKREEIVISLSDTTAVTIWRSEMDNNLYMAYWNKNLKDEPISDYDKNKLCGTVGMTPDCIVEYLTRILDHGKGDIELCAPVDTEIKPGQYIELSTAHISTDTRSLLERDATGETVNQLDNAVCAYTKRMNGHTVGYFVYITNYAATQVPVCLKDCLTFAQQRNASIIVFDRDIEPIPQLPVYPDSEH